MNNTSASLSTRKRSVGVTFVGIFFILSSFPTIIFGSLNFLWESFIVGLLSCILGLGILYVNKWARKVLLFLLFIYMPFVTFYFTVVFLIHAMTKIAFQTIPGLLLGFSVYFIMPIVCFCILTRPRVKQQFEQRNQQGEGEHGVQPLVAINKKKLVLTGIILGSFFIVGLFMAYSNHPSLFLTEEAKIVLSHEFLTNIYYDIAAIADKYEELKWFGEANVDYENFEISYMDDSLWIALSKHPYGYVPNEGFLYKLNGRQFSIDRLGLTVWCQILFDNQQLRKEIIEIVRRRAYAMRRGLFRAKGH